WLSCLTINEGEKVTPEDIRLALAKENIESRPIWKPMHMQPVYKNNDFIMAENRAVSEDIFARGICLPSDNKMTKQQQGIVIEIIKGLFV
ncbi:DegT/DnrJ/EryC1/StrS family aminotransferase, partial [Phascolarctobacterium faecium]